MKLRRAQAWLAVFSVLYGAHGGVFNESDRMCQKRANCLRNTVYNQYLHCQCDPLCGVYGDCCPDSSHFVPGPFAASCQSVSDTVTIYIFNTCPSEWKDDRIRGLCEDTPMSDEDPLLKTPVTHAPTSKTYGNIYCATCNSVEKLDNLTMWRLELKCNLNETESDVRVKRQVIYESGSGVWGVKMFDKFYPCILEIVTPHELDEHFLRRCSNGIVRECSPEWNGTSFCHSYTTVVTNKDTKISYRNPDCAKCNFVPLEALRCFVNANRDIPLGGKYSFAMLFDFMPNEDDIAVGKSYACQKQNQLYDPFFGMCRDVVCSGGQIYKHGKCLVSEDFDDESYDVELNKNTSFYNCPKVVLDPENFVVSSDNTSIYIQKYNTTYNSKDFVIFSDGRVQICTPSTSQIEMYKFNSTMRYVTLVGLGVSIFFLVLHLFAFALCQELRNLSGKNLASLCVALLCSYSAYIVMSEVQKSGIWCAVTGFATYYSLMASFSWSLAIGFDIWNTLRLATSQFKISSGKQNAKFILYSLWGWMFPFILLTLVCVAEYANSDVMSDAIKPTFGNTSCWFENRHALSVFFAAPSGVIMIFNFIFACCSASLVITTTNAANNNDTTRSVRLYVRLAILMGLTWSLGLVAGYFDVEFLWYLYIACNTLQGFFIFFAFTCTRKILKQIKSRLWKKKSKFSRRKTSTSCWPGISTSSSLNTKTESLQDKTLRGVYRSSQ